MDFDTFSRFKSKNRKREKKKKRETFVFKSVCW